MDSEEPPCEGFLFNILLNLKNMMVWDAQTLKENVFWSIRGTLQGINISHQTGKGKSSSKFHFWGIWGYVSSLEGIFRVIRAFYFSWTLSMFVKRWSASSFVRVFLWDTGKRTGSLPSLDFQPSLFCRPRCSTMSWSNFPMITNRSLPFLAAK